MLALIGRFAGRTFILAARSLWSGGLAARLGVVLVIAALVTAAGGSVLADAGGLLLLLACLFALYAVVVRGR